MNAHVKRWFDFYVSGMDAGQEFTVDDVREYIRNRSPKNTPNGNEISYLAKTHPRVRKSEFRRGNLIVWVVM